MALRKAVFREEAVKQGGNAACFLSPLTVKSGAIFLLLSLPAAGHFATKKDKSSRAMRFRWQLQLQLKNRYEM